MKNLATTRGTLADTSVVLRPHQPVRVRHAVTGEEGFAAVYGRKTWGEVRVSIFADENAARQASVSDDVGPHVLWRCINLERKMHEWKLVR